MEFQSFRWLIVYIYILGSLSISHDVSTVTGQAAQGSTKYTQTDTAVSIIAYGECTKL